MQLNSYLGFDGNCEEAFNFYKECLGGEIVGINRYGETPEDMPCPPGWEQKVMHVCMAVGGQTLMGSDAPPEHFSKMQGFHVSINLDDAGKAESIFEKLSAGGEIQMPIEETFWAERFGMFVDKFGTPWMINCMKAE